MNSYLSPPLLETPFRILVCPSGFKESLKPHVAADCIEEGILRVMPWANIVKAPMVDGGEGFTEALVAATGGELRELEVVGPVAQMVSSHFGFLGGDRPKTAVIEMAAAAGLSLVPRNMRSPLHTTTYGVGELIKAALDEGVEYILVGCGDSGTCDGGVGMAQALGARFFSADGSLIPRASGGHALSSLARVDMSDMHPRLKEVQIDVACNWQNVLCGQTGVARVFGPQKGATKDEVEELERAMHNVATVVSTVLDTDISQAPGSGASGGLGAGLRMIGACLYPRYDIIMKFLDIDELIDQCDMIITAEGGIDYQTPRGKIPSEVARRARSRNTPVVALAGTVGEGASVNYEAGIHAFASIMQSPMSLERAIEEAERLLIDAAETTMRMVMVGCAISRSVTPEARSRTGSESYSPPPPRTVETHFSKITSFELADALPKVMQNSPMMLNI